MPLYFAYGSNMDVERHGPPLPALEGAWVWRGSSGIASPSCARAG